jgi:hypothetical protein
MNSIRLSLFLGCCGLALLPTVFPAQAEGAGPASRGDNWVTIESGSRPAYVGIHGGTAPISLLRASNGLLFAFTGQTGNDFLHILRGNATQAPGLSPAERDEKTAALADAAGRAEGRENLKEAAPSLPASPPLPPDGPALARLETGTPPSPARNEAPGENALSPAPTGSLAPPPEAEAPAASTAGPPQASPPPPAAAEAVAPQAAIPAAVEAILADVPAGGPSLVFASGELAHAITESRAFVPFGLPLPGEKAGGAEEGEVLKTPAFKPLKLRDYRPLLRHTGAV